MTTRVKVEPNGANGADWFDDSALHFTHLQKAVSIGYVALLAVASGLVVAADPQVLRFAPITAGELSKVLLPLILVSLFVERAVEVVVTAWRQGTRDQIELAVEGLTESGESATRLRHDLAAHKDGTRSVALLTSVVVGVLLAALGMRSLELIVDADMLAALPGWQQAGFGILDVAVTGALIAGGADGIHKVLATFTGFMEESSKRIRTRKQ